MSHLDIQALNDRFDMMPMDLQVIIQNQPPEDIDETRIYCRWVVDLGASDRAEQGPNARVLQLGTATLQIIAPPGSYQEDAYEIRQQFVDLFRDYRTPDRKLAVFTFRDTKREVRSTADEPGYLQLNVQFDWRSYRVYPRV